MSLVLPIFVLGVMASLSPTTLIVFLLLLATTRARVNAVAFLAGWTFSLTAVFAVGYLVGSEQSLQRGSGRTIVDLIEVAIGAVLVAAGTERWRRRHAPRTGQGVPKAVAARLAHVHPWQAVVLGVLVQPWTVTIAAAIVVVRHHLALLLAVLAFLVFTVVSITTVGLTFLYYSRHTGDAQVRLSQLRERVVSVGPVLFAAVAVLVGCYLIIDGLVDLFQ